MSAILFSQGRPLNSKLPNKKLYLFLIFLCKVNSYYVTGSLLALLGVFLGVKVFLGRRICINPYRGLKPYKGWGWGSAFNFVL
jgi:hypothetical protein